MTTATEQPPQQQQQQQQQQSSQQPQQPPVPQTAPIIGGVDIRDPVKMAEAFAKQLEESKRLNDELGKYRDQENKKKAARGDAIAGSLKHTNEIISKMFNGADGKLLPPEKIQQLVKLYVENQDLQSLEDLASAYEVIEHASADFAETLGEFSKYKELYEKEKTANAELQTQLKLYQVSAGFSGGNGVASRFQQPTTVNSAASATTTTATATTPTPTPVQQEQQQQTDVKKRNVELDFKAFKKPTISATPEQPAAGFDFSKMSPESLDSLMTAFENRRAQMEKEYQDNALRQSLSSTAAPAPLMPSTPREVASTASASSTEYREDDFYFYLQPDHASKMLNSRTQQHNAK